MLLKSDRGKGNSPSIRRRSLAASFLMLFAPIATTAAAQSSDEIERNLDDAIARRQHRQTDESGAAPSKDMGGSRDLVEDNQRDTHQDLYPTSPPPTPPPAEHIEDFTINFASASARLLPDSSTTLASIADVLRNPRYAEMVFLVIGHTDNRGSDQYNLALSRKRADSVVAALVKRGVSTAMLLSVGMGKRQLKNKADGAAKENRRVELVLR